jgi:2,3-bisphosphoglycerate-independent phosphoglycerate mutase
VTYFWNGNRSGKTSQELEVFDEIPSDLGNFDIRPWMKSADIADKIIEAIESEEYGFIRANFPNGDMVGHTGSMQSTIIGVEAVDLALSRIVKTVEARGAVLIVTADHGNADEMLEKSKSGKNMVKTAHSLNAVPFILYNTKHKLKRGAFGLSNVTPTIAQLLGVPSPQCWVESMIAV